MRGRGWVYYYIYIIRNENTIYVRQLLAETAVLPAREVSISPQACLPARIVRIYSCEVVVAIVVESTKGFEQYYCSTPR